MTTTATTPADLDITAVTPKGNTYKLAVYVDPFPGRKGDETIKETCGKCGGDKVVHWGNVTLATSQGEDRWCFECMGAGFTTRKVSSARSTARRQIKAENQRRADAADWAAEAPAREAAEAAQALLEEQAAAKREEERLAAMTQGFEAEVGTRIRNLECEVVTEYQYEALAFNGYSMELRAIIVFKAIESGKTLKWSTGARGLEKGDKVLLTGTVKEHDNYKGQDQTVLTRCIIK